MPELLDHEATAPDFGEPADLFDYDESSWQDAGEPVDGEPDSVVDEATVTEVARPNFQLREYQETTVSTVLELLKTSSSTMAVLFTSAGKTVILAELIKRWPTGRVLVLAHRQELIYQAAKKIEWVTGKRPDIDMAGERAVHGEFSDGGPVVGSVQTISRLRRLNLYDWNEFGLIVVDECHHCIEKNSQYFNIIHAAKKANPDIKLFGVTATPDRSDEHALANMFDSVAVRFPIRYGLEEGYTVEITQRIVRVDGLDFSKVRTSMGDLKESDLTAAFDAVPEEVVKAVAAAIEIANGRKCLWFCVSVAQAEMVANEINKIAGHRAGFVCGGTDKEARKQIFLDYARGDFMHLTGVGCMTEGYDEPTVSAIVDMRPTKSRCLHEQKIGRGIRVLPNVIDGLHTAEERKAAIAASAKPDCLIIDLCGNTGKHTLSTVAGVLGEEDKLAIERAMAQADRYLAGGATVRQAVKKAREDIDREEKEADEKKAAEIAKAKEERDRINAEYVRKKQEDAARFAEYVKAKYTTEATDPFAGDRAPSADRFAASGTASKLSEYQCKKLLDNGINPDSLTLWQAKAKLAELADKPSPRQIETLAKFGEPHVTTKARAEVLFAVIQQDDGKWKKRDFPLTPAAFRVRELEGRKPAYVVDVVSPAGREIRVKRNNKVGGQWVPQAIIFNTPQAANQYISQAVDAVAFGGGI